MQAKARRLARFNFELTQPAENLLDANRKTPENKLSQASVDKWDADKPAEARDSLNRENLLEIESSESSPVVVGLCPDMCPGSSTTYFKPYVCLLHRDSNTCQSLFLLKKTKEYIELLQIYEVDICSNISESERGERERKGDLDKYERLDGDRNQTSKYLAVKKVVTK